MSTCPFQTSVEAYHDRDIDPHGRSVVEAHLEHCAACAAHLAWLRSVSATLATRPAGEITGAELHRLHDAIDASNDPYPLSLYRTASVLMAIAASILIVSFVWLNELSPAPGVPVPGPVAVSEVPAWERVAVTLRADPPPEVGADVHLADANLADWMVTNLSGRPLDESR
jgi:anti-sigma factor RsiW